MGMLQEGYGLGSSVMDESAFASRVRLKYPGYEGVDDRELTRRVLDRFPEYRPRVKVASARCFFSSIEWRKLVERVASKLRLR